MTVTRHELKCDRCGKSLGAAPVTSNSLPDFRLSVTRPGVDVEVVTFQDCCPECSARIADLLAAIELKAPPERERRKRRPSAGGVVAQGGTAGVQS